MINYYWGRPTYSSMAQTTLSSKCLALAHGYLASPVADIQSRTCFSNGEQLLADDRWEHCLALKCWASVLWFLHQGWSRTLHHFLVSHRHLGIPDSAGPSGPNGRIPYLEAWIIQEALFYSGHNTESPWLRLFSKWDGVACGNGVYVVSRIHRDFPRFVLLSQCGVDVPTSSRNFAQTGGVFQIHWYTRVSLKPLDDTWSFLPTRSHQCNGPTWSFLEQFKTKNWAGLCEAFPGTDSSSSLPTHLWPLVSKKNFSLLGLP